MILIIDLNRKKHLLSGISLLTIIAIIATIKIVDKKSSYLLLEEYYYDFKCNRNQKQFW